MIRFQQTRQGWVDLNSEHISSVHAFQGEFVIMMTNGDSWTFRGVYLDKAQKVWNTYGIIQNYEEGES